MIKHQTRARFHAAVIHCLGGLGAVSVVFASLFSQANAAPVIASISATLGSPAPSGAPVIAQANKPLYFAQVKADGAVVRNLMDAKGLDLLTLSADDVVAVWGEESSGWLEVEVSTGYAAYVFGRFLEPTDTNGVYRITRNAINIRPRPADDVTSFPLPQRLHAGDQVAVIGQADPTQPMAEDWVRIWTPPGVRAFIRAENVQRLDQTKGEEAWKQAVQKIGLERAAIVSGTPRSESNSVGANASGQGAVGQVGEAAATTAAGSAAGTSAKRDAEARLALGRIRSRVQAEQGKATPDFGGAQAELSSLLAGVTDIDLKAEFTRELERVNALSEAAAMFQELQRIKEQKDQETARLQKTIWEESRRLDPLGSSFDVHGVLVRRIEADGTPRYTVEVRREVVAEILCTTGRYNLDVFSGYEVGVKGRTVVAEAAASKEKAPSIPVLDVARLSVLKRR